MSMYVPTGLGIGANCEKFTGQERAMWQQAMDRLGAAWSYTWGRLDVGPGYLPSVHPEWQGICSANDLLAWKHRQMARGLPWDELSWVWCNEPEACGKTPREVASLVVRQLAEFDRADIRLRLLFPNGNINTLENFDYTREVTQRVRQAGVLISPAVHIWCEAQYVPMVWDRYRNWIEGYGDRLAPITITEAGPGPNCTMAQWLAMLPLVYALLDDPRVGAVAPFAAYPKHRLGIERHPGLMLPDGSLNELGRQYVAERQRRL